MLCHLALPKIDAGKSFERAVQSDQIAPLLLRPHQRFIERNVWKAASALPVLTRARVIHQNSAQQLCEDGKEVCIVLPIHLSGIHWAQVGLVDKRVRLQRVPGTLSEHMPPSETPQLLM